VFKGWRVGDNEEVVVKERSSYERYWFDREVAMYQALHSAVQDKSSPSGITRMHRHFYDPEKRRYAIELEYVPCVSRHFVPGDHEELWQFLQGLSKACLPFPQDIPVCLSVSSTNVAGTPSWVVQALGFLHSCGVIHRDIKPSNLLVSHIPGAHLRLNSLFFLFPSADSLRFVHVTEGSLLTPLSSPPPILGCSGLSVKIADLEHAKFSHEQHPQGSSQGVGTEGYIAPECERDALEADLHCEASDMWAMGIIILELMLSISLAGNQQGAESLASFVVKQTQQVMTSETPISGPKWSKLEQAHVERLKGLLVGYGAKERYFSPPTITPFGIVSGVRACVRVHVRR
jgi:serine/threonine protein kinase